MAKTDTLRSTLVNLANAFVAVTLAPRCASCDAPLESPASGCVCRPCWSIATATPSILWSSDAISIARAGGNFDGPLRDIIHAFKYDGRRSLARPLAALICAASTDGLTGADGAVPVPQHPFRRARRGFNQACDLSARLPLPAVHALWRAHWTTSQSGLNRAERRRNVRNAFALSPLMSQASRDRWLRGKVVVLVDDVRTTGATLNACAAVLSTAGAREVRAVTAAARDIAA
jgi:ComF family protein